MSKIIAQAAIRGAHKLVKQAEEALNKAIQEKGESLEVSFPDTAYYLPVIYSMLGIKARTLGDLKPVLDKAKSLLPPEPSEKVWLPYLGNALDAGMATLFAEEIIEAVKYVVGPNPINGIWIGATDDVTLRTQGIKLVDGSMPGFAACVGALPTNEAAVELATKLREKNILVFMAGETNGKSMAEQLAEEGVQMGWDVYLVPYGKEITAAVYALGFAARAAMTFGGITPDGMKGARDVLLYNKNRVFAFVLALGEVDDAKYATAAGAINFGFPVIADTDIPQILPTGICTYEHVVSNIPHDKLVSTAIEIRGVKIKVTEIPIPVPYGPAFEGERIRKEQTYVEFGGQKSTSFEYLRMRQPDEVEDGKIEVIGPEIESVEVHSVLPLGIAVDVAGRKMQPDFEPVLERQLHHMISSAEGAWHMGQRDLNWLRISIGAKEKGFKIKHFSDIIHAKLLGDFPAIVDKVQVTIYTDESKMKEVLEEARKAFVHRDERVAGLTDEAVDTYYSCTLCVPKGEEIILPDGSFKPIERVIKDTVEEEDTQVLSLEGSSLRAKPISELFINPTPASLLKVTLSNGNSLTLTPNHKVLVDKDEGLVWVKAVQLTIGDHLLSPTTTMFDGQKGRQTAYLIDYLPEEIKVFDDQFLAYLRELILNRYQTFARAAREFKIPYQRLYQSFYFRKDTPYRLGHPRLTLGEIRAIVKKLELSWDEIKAMIQKFGVSRHQGVGIRKVVLDEEITYAAGLVAADGCVVRRGNGTFVQFTNSDGFLVGKFNQIMQSLFGSCPEIRTQEPTISLSSKMRIVGVNSVTICHVHNPIIGQLMRGLGIGADKERKVKWTGEAVSSLSPKLVAAFLRGLFDGDGHVTSSHIHITTRSYREAQHILLLLKKLGISSYISKITRGYQVGTRSFDDYMLFRSIISSDHPRKKTKMEMAKFSRSRNHVVRTNSVPKICGKLLRELLLKEKGKIRVTKLPIDYKTVEAWVKGKRRASKEKLTLLLNDLQNKIDVSDPIYVELRRWASSEVRFEKIKRIETVNYDEREVYNFSVEGTHNYLVNGVVVKNCQSFAPNHVCIISPQRLGLCGAYNWLDAKTAYEINPTGGNQPIIKGEVIDPELGQWKGVTEFVYQKSNKTVDTVSAYSMMVNPETSCGCFECIVALLPTTNGVMIVNREFPGMTPVGMKFSTLAGAVGGGQQTPGFIGVGRQYITSEKFIAADGGFKRIAWMPRELKEALRTQLMKRAEAVGDPDFVNKIVDESMATTEEEVLNFMQRVSHPALEMEPML